MRLEDRFKDELVWYACLVINRDWEYWASLNLVVVITDGGKQLPNRYIRKCRDKHA